MDWRKRNQEEYVRTCTKYDVSKEIYRNNTTCRAELLCLHRKHWYRCNQPHHYQQRLEELNNNKESSLHSFKLFVKHGLLPQEFITINSIKGSIARFFAHFAGSISEYKDGWKDFTVKDSVTNEVNFSGHKFYTPTMHLLEFQKQFCKTQLLASYFEEKRVLDRDEELRAALFIADWVHFNRWKNDKLL